VVGCWVEGLQTWNRGKGQVSRYARDSIESRRADLVLRIPPPKNNLWPSVSPRPANDRVPQHIPDLTIHSSPNRRSYPPARRRSPGITPVSRRRGAALSIASCSRSTQRTSPCKTHLMNVSLPWHPQTVAWYHAGVTAAGAALSIVLLHAEVMRRRPESNVVRAFWLLQASPHLDEDVHARIGEREKEGERDQQLSGVRGPTSQGGSSQGGSGQGTKSRWG
jgi:hypothetical protein